jgi:hypothetical protein
MEGYRNTPETGSTYEEIMGMQAATGDEQLEGGGASSLSNRLATFRQWAADEAKIDMHPSICIVNGEATDGTKNAPVLAFGPPPGNQPLALTPGQGRVGMVDGVADRAMYERTIGCQVRAAKELKKDEIMMCVPKAAMVTPDVVAASDAGRAVLACCQALPKGGDTNFWDAFENTVICERAQSQKAKSSNGTQLLVKILQERKRGENAYSKAIKQGVEPKKNALVPPGVISTRAPVLAFLIHQRFAPNSRPPVVDESIGDFDQLLEADGVSNALKRAVKIKPLDDSPSTFAPYARTLPSSVTVPICWKRNELALLSGCITGIAPLQEVAATTLQLVAEFVALVDAGILTRFPSVFPPGVLSWERWIWAAAVFTSRLFPATTYLNVGEPNAAAHETGDVGGLQSPPEVWNELGVMVPVLDMLNHEIDTHQVVWQPNRPKYSIMAEDPEDESIQEPHPPRAVVHTKVKKGQQIYTCYGNLSNRHFMLQYGFCQIANQNDETRVGWGLMDAVGNVPPPADYAPLFDISDEATKFQVYESNDSVAVNDWWSDERLMLLEYEVAQNVDSSFMSSLKMGKKMTGAAHCDGTYDPILLTTALVGTMPAPELAHHMAQRRGADKIDSPPITISRRHQHVLRSYLGFIFSQKLQKLLENLDTGLKGHFGGARLWTKTSQGGIRYKKPEEGAEESQLVGWQTFFDERAYTTTMEVEKRYYAISPDSCVLTLYDGQLQALQATLDGLSTWEKFEQGVMQQLQDLGFRIGNVDETIPDEIEIKPDVVHGNTGQPSVDKQVTKPGDDQKKDDGKSPKKNRRNRKRNSSSGGSDRPPAIKLHIGNLSYQTLANDLFDFFAREHGRDNILECHIPTERETGKSRGFGFVTLPEAIARPIITSGRKFELDGRILKVAESNSAGTNKPNRYTGPPPANERCATCGYRPKYCVCQAPNLPGHSGGGPHMDHGREYDHYGSSRHRRDRSSRSPSPSYRDRGRRSSRDEDYYRDHSRDRRSYRSRSRSYSRDRDRRDRRRDRKSRDDSRSRERDRSRDRSIRDRSRSPRDRSRDRSRERSRDRYDRHSRRRSRDRRSRGSRHSRSRSPSYSRRERSNVNGDPVVKLEPMEGRNDSGASPDPARPMGAGEDGRAPDSNRKRRSRSRSRGRSNKKSRKKKRQARSRSRSISPGAVV